MSYDDNGQPVQCVPFNYPSEDIPTIVDDDHIRHLLSFLYHYVLTDSNPTITLIATLYNAGYDIGALYHCPNTLRSIARAQGINHLTLWKKSKQVAKDIGLTKKYESQTILILSGSISGSIQQLHTSHTSTT